MNYRFTELMPFMETHDGSKFGITNIEDNYYDINTIAHALSNICRYGGHCSNFYSVAEHSTLMADYIYNETKDKNLAYECLMHDAAEAYMGDIPRPLKYTLVDYRNLLGKVEKAIIKKFGLKEYTPVIVKELDAMMVRAERGQVMRNSANLWDTDSLPLIDITVLCLEPKSAEEDFLDAYYYYSTDEDDECEES